MTKEINNTSNTDDERKNRRPSNRNDSGRSGFNNSSSSSSNSRDSRDARSNNYRGSSSSTNSSRDGYRGTSSNAGARFPSDSRAPRSSGFNSSNASSSGERRPSSNGSSSGYGQSRTSFGDGARAPRTERSDGQRTSYSREGGSRDGGGYRGASSNAGARFPSDSRAPRSSGFNSSSSSSSGERRPSFGDGARAPRTERSDGQRTSYNREGGSGSRDGGGYRGASSNAGARFPSDSRAPRSSSFNSSSSGERRPSFGDGARAPRTERSDSQRTSYSREGGSNNSSRDNGGYRGTNSNSSARFPSDSRAPRSSSFNSSGSSASSSGERRPSFRDSAYTPHTDRAERAISQRRESNNSNNGNPNLNSTNSSRPNFADVKRGGQRQDNRNGGYQAVEEKKNSNSIENGVNFKKNINDENIRIQKLLGELGVGSRRNIEKLIELGKITVNGQKAILGQRINISDNVFVNNYKVNLHAKEWLKPRIIMYHKTSGEIVSHADPEGRPSVFDHLPFIKNGKWIAIGRLDFNTEGLLLFTNNGNLANKFMHPSFGIEREYAVRVLGKLEPETIEQLLKGILLDDGLANFSKVEDAGGENLNHWYKVTLSEGRNREVRRMFEAVGLTVSRLTRVRYGNLKLSSRLQRGKYQELSEDDVQVVLESFGVDKDTI